jgi:hypothetical protein
MSVLRILVLTASTLQIIFGACGTYHLLQEPAPDLFGMLLCSAVIIVGLASFAGLLTRIRPSLSRIATVKINLLILMLGVIGAGVVYAFEQSQGASDRQLRFLVFAFAFCASPFIVNSIALGLIERRLRSSEYLRSVT